MQDRIRNRAYDLFESRGRTIGRDLEHWLAAEHELAWKPPIEILERNGQFSIRIAIPEVDSKDIDMEVTPEYLLLKAEVLHEHHEDEGKLHVCEFRRGNLFRSIRFPKEIDPGGVKAELKNGMLQVTARIAGESRAKKVELKAS
jgi:HSP20 family protein